MKNRTIEGFVQMPEGEVGSQWGAALVELRDVSAVDAPSGVIASVRLPHARLAAGARLPFALEAPEASPAATLNLRVQLQGGVLPAGPAEQPRPDGSMYLTTQAYTVPPTGDVRGMVVALEKVSG